MQTRRSQRSQPNEDEDTLPPYRDLRDPSRVAAHLTLTEFGSFFRSEIDAKLFFEDVGCLESEESAKRTPRSCPDCGYPSLRVERTTGNLVSWRYRCGSPSTGSEARCRFSVTPLQNTFFYRSKLSFRDNLKVMFCFITKQSITDLWQDLGGSNKTACDYSGFCKEICTWSIRQSLSPIGGVDAEGRPLSVELDETFTRRKYNHGRPTWFENSKAKIFGGICRETKEMFVFAVPCLTKEVLWPLIAAFVRPGSRVFTDGATVYRGIAGDQGRAYGIDIASHDTVNHSRGEYARIDEDSDGEEINVSTNSIENNWRWLKEAIGGNRRLDLDGLRTCLYTYHFFKVHFQGAEPPGKRPGEKLLIFLQEVKKFFPGPFQPEGQRHYEPIRVAVEGVDVEI